MSYPCYDYQLGRYLYSASDRRVAERELGMVALTKGEEVKAKTPEKIDIKKQIWENMKMLEQNPYLRWKSIQDGKKAKWEYDNKWYHETYGYGKYYHEGY